MKPMNDIIKFKNTLFGNDLNDIMLLKNAYLPYIIGSQLDAHYVTWVLEENRTACRFYEKCGGQFFKNKSVEIGDQNYIEIAYLFHRQEGRDEKYS